MDKAFIQTQSIKAWPEYFEFRRNKNGWVFRIYRVLIRWNKQDAYTAFSIEKIGKSNDTI